MGGKYFVGLDQRGGSWYPWVKEISSGKIVSMIMDSGSSALIDGNSACTIDSKYIISSPTKDNILYVPSHIYFYAFNKVSNVGSGPIGTIISETIYKENVSGNRQYTRVYIVQVGYNKYVFVRKEGVTCSP